MIVCGVDTETTGIDTNSDRIVELGAVLWCTEENKPIKFFSEFLFTEGQKVIPEAASKVNGLSQSFIEQWGKSPSFVMNSFSEFIKPAEYFVAHNGLSFDKPLIERHLKECGIEVPTIPWIDSRYHLPIDTSGSRKLIHLAAENGILNPFAHRAVTDVLTMLILCSKFSWSDIIRISTLKRIKIRALVSISNKDLAKNLNYKYEPLAKFWVKEILEDEFQKEKTLADEAGFNIMEIR